MKIRQAIKVMDTIRIGGRGRLYTTSTVDRAMKRIRRYIGTHGLVGHPLLGRNSARRAVEKALELSNG